MRVQPGPVRRVVRVVGTTFFALGCLGFVPGMTFDLEQIHLTGPGSSTALLGVLPVTVMGNLVHLSLALAARLCPGDEARARVFLVSGGALYAALCARSLVVGTGTSATTPGAHPGLWVALAAGVAMLVAGALATVLASADPPWASGARQPG